MAAVSVGLAVRMIDTFVVKVAFPAISRDLDAGISRAEWTLSGYVLVLGVFPLAMGRLGDIFGRRLVRLCGLVLPAPAGDSPPRRLIPAPVALRRASRRCSVHTQFQRFLLHNSNVYRQRYWPEHLSETDFALRLRRHGSAFYTPLLLLEHSK